MKNVRRFKVLLLTFMIIVGNCTPSSSTSSSKQTSSGVKIGTPLTPSSSSVSTSITTATGTAATEPDPQKKVAGDVRHNYVSAFSIDDDRFLILNFTVGLQTLLHSQTPVLNFDPILDNDYVEIMRCPVNAVIAGATATLNLKDLELSGISLLDRQNMYRRNDFWSSAIRAGCVQLTTGATEKVFFDSWAPSGSYRYMARICISPQRMTDLEKLSNRNCSRQVAITVPVKDYVNTRSEAHNEYNKKANIASNKIVSGLVAGKQMADKYACYLQWCECGAGEQTICQRDENGVPAPCTGGNRGALVAKTKKDAIVTLVGVGLDLLTNAACSGPMGGFKGITTAYKSIGGMFGQGMNILGYGASLSGMSFSNMLKELSVQTQDFQHSCAQGISTDQQLAMIAQQLEADYAEYNYYECRALAAQTTTAAGAGDASAAEADFSMCPTSTAPVEETPVDTSTGGTP